ncbi:hypothetical protein AC1031_004761 [Aphanomyces cochlioides]|nr:hypothetical protein AC1031_004761 [Aphanomyces cochlioides]
MTLSAAWTRGLEVEFISALCDATKNPRFVASTGKNLRAAGWQSVLAKMVQKEASIKTVEQLKSKWKRLKADYADYHFLVGLFGFGAGFDGAKWQELDACRNATSRLSRFRNDPYIHYDIMAMTLGDTMATREGLSTLSDVLEATDDKEMNDDDDETILNTSLEADKPIDDLSRAQKRAKILHELKKNRKRKNTQEDNEIKQARRDAVDAIQGIHQALNRLVEAYVEKSRSEM